MVGLVHLTRAWKPLLHPSARLEERGSLARQMSYWFQHEGSKRAGLLGVLNTHPGSLEVLNDKPSIYVMQSALKL